MIVNTAWLGKEHIHYESIDSTNIRGRILAGENASHGTVITANMQSAGVGRRGRSWESDEGAGVYMTLLLRPQIRIENASMLTLVAALSVTKAIEICAEVTPQIKWPNDIVLHKKKIGGILTEMGATIEGIDYVLVGIGINVSNRTFADAIADMATSLFLECQKEIDKNVLLSEICKQFETYYAIFYQTEDFSVLAEEYNSYLVNKDMQVSVIDPKNPFIGIAKGITIRGELQVETEQGMVYVSSGEVSVRGMYGYV